MLEKQGQRRSEHRRILGEKHKERNRRLYLDVWGHSRWNYLQYESDLSFWFGFIKDRAKYALRHINELSSEELLDLWRSINKLIKECIGKDEDHLEPWPREKEMRADFRKYRDDPGRCDKSGREDLRPDILKKTALQEIAEFKTVEHGGKCNCFDCQEERCIDFELRSEDEFISLETIGDYDYEEEYAQQVKDGLFDYDDDLNEDFYCCGDHTICCCTDCNMFRAKLERKPLPEVPLEDKLKLADRYCQVCHNLKGVADYCDCVHQMMCDLYDPDRFYTEEDLPDALEL